LEDARRAISLVPRVYGYPENERIEVTEGDVDRDEHRSPIGDALAERRWNAPGSRARCPSSIQDDRY
jgi:hypothetical protein